MERFSEKPHTIVYGQHTIEHVDQLQPFGNAIVSLLESIPQGKVGVIIEDAGGKFLEGKVLSLLVQSGMSPSDALYTAAFAVKKNKLPTPKEFQQIKKTLQVDPFVKAEFALLDAISLKYPSRLHIMPEWGEEEDVDVLHMDSGELRPLRLKRDALKHAYKGNFSDALPLFKESVELTATSGQNRDQKILGIHARMEQDEDIIGVVSFMGSFHTGQSHALVKAGFETYTIHAAQENGKLIYSPDTIASRYRSFFPDREVSEEQWNIALAQTVVYEAFYRGLMHQGFAFTEQEAAQLTFEKTKNYRIEDVEKLQNALKANPDTFLVVWNSLGLESNDE